MKQNKIFLVLSLWLILFCTIRCRDKAVKQSYGTLFHANQELPASIQHEHDTLLATLRTITLSNDSVGIRATRLLELMEHHFSEEENLVFPQLGLLPLLADNEIPDNAEEIIQLTDNLKSQLGHMSAEHQLIGQYLKELLDVTLKDDLPEMLSFIQDVEKHAAAEEEIYFPAAILVGEYLRMKSREQLN